jgi:hypothetical protein
VVALAGRLPAGALEDQAERLLQVTKPLHFEHFSFRHALQARSAYATILYHNWYGTGLVQTAAFALACEGCQLTELLPVLTQGVLT